MIIFLSNKTKLVRSNVPGDDHTLVYRYAQIAISRKHLSGSFEDHLRSALREVVSKALEGYELRTGFDDVSLTVNLCSTLTAVASAYGDRHAIVPEVVYLLMGRETENGLDTLAATGSVRVKVMFEVSGSGWFWVWKLVAVR